MRVQRAIIGKDHNGWYVEDSWTDERAYMGRNKCKTVCGQINKAAALEKERSRRVQFGLVMGRNRKQFKIVSRGANLKGEMIKKRETIPIVVPTLDMYGAAEVARVVANAAQWKSKLTA